MSKTYEMDCPKHGHIRIEVEKPPILPGRTVYCPWCAQRLAKLGEGSKVKWELNPTGVKA